MRMVRIGLCITLSALVVAFGLPWEGNKQWDTVQQDAFPNHVLSSVVSDATQEHEWEISVVTTMTK